MEYKVRKGMETPCRIGVFLSGDYWVVYSASVAAIGLCVLAAAQGLTEGHWEFFWSMLGICSVTEPLLCREITLSNLEMARTLYRIRERHRKEQL